MALDNKYGQVEVPGIPEDEPVFILRAQDVLSLPILARYRNMRREAEQKPPTEEWVRDLDSVIGNFSAWQANHLTKLPD